MWCSHWYQQHHSIKSCVTYCFSCLHLMNKMVSLNMQLATYDSSATSNIMTWLKRSCFIIFESLWPNECSGAICNTTGITAVSRYCVYMCRYIRCVFIVNTFRHCLEMLTHPDMSRHKLTLSRHIWTLCRYLYTMSTYIKTLFRQPYGCTRKWSWKTERLCNGLERYASVCNWNMYFYSSCDSQM